MRLNTKKGALWALFFSFASTVICAQSYFSKRIDIANKLNLATKLLFINDTFFVPAAVYEVPYTQASSSLVKIDKHGVVTSALRFKPIDRSYFGSYDALLYNRKFYSTVVTDWGLQVQQGFCSFNFNSDTILTRSYGDTAYYNYARFILPFLKTKGKFILLGSTDSSCGPNHPGIYKPIIRIVDTNGILYSTKLLNSVCYYHSIANADTTIKKGYVFSGAEVLNNKARNYIIKLDSNLNQQWNKYVDTGGSLSNCVISIKKGGLVFAHNHTDSIQANTYNYDRISLSKLDFNGNLIWRKRYGNSEKDISVSRVKECANGDFILCGQKFVNYSQAANQLVGWLMRTDSLGNLKWWYYYIPDSPVRDTIAQNYLYDLIELPNKNIASVGYVGGSGTFNTIVQTWLLKVDSNGCYQNGCAQPVAVTEQNLNDKKINVYPNPFKDILHVDCKLDYNNNALLELTDVSTGRVLISRKITQDESSFKLDTYSLQSGVYVVSYIRDNKAPVFYKVVKIKE